jgi:hypothetical protein
MTTPACPAVRCVPATTNETLLRFFGTLMPALLLLKQAPGQLWSLWRTNQLPPEGTISDFIQAEVDDVGSMGNTLVFVHRWQSSDRFDAVAFARAKVFLHQLTRWLQAEGYQATPLDPLSPHINLPALAAQAGLGNLSPYGLLVHPRFGPRVILTGVTTDYALDLAPREQGQGCTDCMACVRQCPQKPIKTGFVHMSQCKSCTRCLTICPVGK